MSNLTELMQPGPAWLSLGVVTEVSSSSSFGWLVTLELTDDGRTVQARPMWLMGGAAGEGAYTPIAAGDEALVFFPAGDPNRALCLVGPSSKPNQPPTGWNNDRVELVHTGGTEVRTSQGATVQPVLLADLDTELAKALAEMAALIKSLGLPTPLTDAYVTQLNAGAWRSAALKAE